MAVRVDKKKPVAASPEEKPSSPELDLWCEVLRLAVQDYHDLKLTIKRLAKRKTGARKGCIQKKTKDKVQHNYVMLVEWFKSDDIDTPGSFGWISSFLVDGDPASFMQAVRAELKKGIRPGGRFRELSTAGLLPIVTSHIKLTFYS